MEEDGFIALSAITLYGFALWVKWWLWKKENEK
jgi:hypothetical protein